MGLGRFFSFLILRQSVGLLGRRISPSQGRYLHTEQTHTDIHVLSEIRTHDSSVRASEDGSCLIDRAAIVNGLNRYNLSVLYDSGSW
jgi:hypothetical protein